MAITIGAAIKQSATQAPVISDTSAIADGAFNAGTLTALTPTDEVYTADMVLDIQMLAAPTAGAAIHLYRRDLNIEGTNDASVPDTDFEHIYIGSFPLDLVGTRQYIPLPAVPISADQEFYIKNDGDGATTGTTALYATPNTPNVKT